MSGEGAESAQPPEGSSEAYRRGWADGMADRDPDVSQMALGANHLNDTPCRPPAPECPHPWHAASKARIAARFAALRAARNPNPADRAGSEQEESRG